MQHIFFSLLFATMVLGGTAAQAFEDPTRPPTAVLRATAHADAQASGWVLSSILVSPRRRIAIINGQSVQQGDLIGAARVLEIDSTGVTLVTDSERVRLGLLPADMKKVRK
ncbi:MAG: general secretion pathway protein GspB [Granulosicoccaceae bacterium]|jgi:MSHA biogenesis protein MshK